MPRCPSCSHEVSGESRYCSACGAATGEPSFDPTRTTTPRGSAAEPRLNSGAPVRIRFLSGDILAGRYRIVAPLGAGGMGEVYRADDLKLGQPVALKFLPESVERDPTRLARLLSEVRTARQISHANVCRVHDIGEADGHHFISMEYVDGEDLSSLLKRIGHLPKDKAVQVAHQLCAGLAAAHEQGILHRDLKPANVMLDGRGRVRVTDFGLAVAAATVTGSDTAVGTPAYMAPEQRAGKEFTARSDIYALGLVLYELFTGQPAFKASSAAELARLQSEATPTSPSSLVEGLDPAVERAVLRCLRSDPRERPGSALQVAASLPGGDPLAAALAAGETPSPELVADAGAAGGLRPAVAWACLASALIGLVLVPWTRDRSNAVSLVGLPKSPAALVERAHDIAKKLGHPASPLDEAYWFDGDPDLLDYIERTDNSEDRWKKLSGMSPSALTFIYRSSPRYLVPQSLAIGVSGVGLDDPPRTVSGMITLALDPDGRLTAFEAIPPQRDPPVETVPKPDWTVLLHEAGLQARDLKEVAPVENPLLTCDARAAWEGPLAVDPTATIRYEAGAYRGAPVYFETIPPWRKPTRMEVSEPGAGKRIGWYVAVTLFLVFLIGGALLARRNLRLGRGDRRGAYRLAVYHFATGMIVWLIFVRHVPEAGSELGLFFSGAGIDLLFSAICWTVYIALEPLVRRMWPDALISWSRVLMGRLRDPLVGRDLLVGVLVGTLLNLCESLTPALDSALGFPAEKPSLGVWGFASLREVIGVVFQDLRSCLFFPFVVLFFLVLFRIVLRKSWLAVIAVSVLFGGLFSLVSGSFAPSNVLGVVFILLSLLVLIRFGLLTLVALDFTGAATTMDSITADLSRWYAPYGVLVLAVVATLALYGFRASLAGRPLFGRALLED